MKQYEFTINIKGLGSSAEDAWADAIEKFNNNPLHKRYKESFPGQEVAIIDLNGNVIGEGFLVDRNLSSLEEYTEIDDSDIIGESDV